MPHFILEHSSNITAKDLALDSLFEKLHDTAVATELFPLAGIRSRAHACEHFRIANGDASYAFVHLMAKVGSGRTLAELEKVSQLFFAVLSDHFQSQSNSRGFAISYEMTELPTVLKYNKNNLRDYIN